MSIESFPLVLVGLVGVDWIEFEGLVTEEKAPPPLPPTLPVEKAEVELVSLEVELLLDRDAEAGMLGVANPLELAKDDRGFGFEEGVEGLRPRL